MDTLKMKSSVSVLMVCLGNICRSPLAETALRIIADRNGLDIRIDSAGTGHWHIGHPPDARAREVAGKLGGVEIGNLRARQVQMDDFYKFDHIIAMDDENLRYLNAMKSEDATAKLSLCSTICRDMRGSLLLTLIMGMTAHSKSVGNRYKRLLRVLPL